MNWKFWLGMLWKKVLWEIDILGTIQYKTILRGWSDSICSNCVYNVYLLPYNCSKKKHHAVTKFIVPWTQGIQHGISR